MPITVVELDRFSRDAAEIWSDDERSQVIGYLASRPDVGDVIPGTHGLRKLRWRAGGKGKRSGARVIYFWRGREGRILLLAVYVKGSVADLTRAELSGLADLARGF